MNETLIQRISKSLLVPEKSIMQVIQSASHQYKTYTIAKRNGDRRTIHHPSKRLKALQRWIATEVISKFPVHESAMAYRQGISIRDNAEAHRGSAFLLRMDFSKFFESISSEDIVAFLGSVRDFKPHDIDTFVKLVCRNGALTIGAPSSPSLSNAMCLELDSRIAAYCSAHEINYTRYADDLFFSTTKPNILGLVPDTVANIIASLPYPANLSINKTKTKHSSKKGLRRITGLTLTPDGGVVVGRGLKRSVRARIYKFDGLDNDAREQLLGHLAYIQSIDPDFINALTEKYGSKLISRVLSRPKGGHP